MAKNGDIVRVREVYAIAQRLEEKIDKLDRRVSNIEGKVSVLAIVWSSIISIAGITMGFFLRK